MFNAWTNLSCIKFLEQVKHQHLNYSTSWINCNVTSCSKLLMPWHLFLLDWTVSLSKRLLLNLSCQNVLLQQLGYYTMCSLRKGTLFIYCPNSVLLPIIVFFTLYTIIKSSKCIYWNLSTKLMVLRSMVCWKCLGSEYILGLCKGLISY